MTAPEICESRSVKKNAGGFERYTSSYLLLLPTVLLAPEEWIPNPGYTLESPGNLLKFLIPMPRSMISESPGVGPRHPYFLKISRQF